MSSVTSVRSIQSLRAQRAASTSEIPTISFATSLIVSASRRIRLGSRTLTTKRYLPLAGRAKNLTRHIVSANRQLPAVDSARILETEHIAGHTAVERNARGQGGTAERRHRDHSGDLCSLLLQLQLDRRCRPDARDVLGHERTVDPIAPRTADGARDRQHKEHSREVPRLRTLAPGHHRGGD